MKNYNNIFYSVLDKISLWDESSIYEKESIISNLLEIKKKPLKLTKYFERFDKNFLRYID